REPCLVQPLAGGPLQARLESGLLALPHLRRGTVHRLDGLVQDQLKDRGPFQLLLQTRCLLAQPLLGVGQAPEAVELRVRPEAAPARGRCPQPPPAAAVPPRLFSPPPPWSRLPWPACDAVRPGRPALRRSCPRRSASEADARSRRRGPPAPPRPSARGS